MKLALFPYVSWRVNRSRTAHPPGYVWDFRQNNPGIYTVAKPKMMLILNLHAFISSVNMLLGKLGASSRIQAISQARVLSLL
jgi:hypothetical protein